MQKVVYLYNLKKGVTMEEYRKFAVRDSKITPKQPGVLKFEAFEVEGTNRADIPCRIMEVVDVSSYSQWQKVLKSKELSANARRFKDVVDESSVSVWYGAKVIQEKLEDAGTHKRKTGDTARKRQSGR